MDNVTNDFLLEQFRRVRADIAELKEIMISFGVRAAGTDHLVAGQQLKIVQYADDMEALRRRLDRIEARLDLVES